MLNSDWSTIREVLPLMWVSCHRVILLHSYQRRMWA